MQRQILKLSGHKNVPPKRKKVAAYVRVSSGKDAMMHSLSAQISYYSKLIQDNPNWQYCGVYADEAKTGTKDSRPEFQRLLEDCKQGKIDMIITKSISRFARNTLTVLETVRELKKLGIDVYFEKENIHSLSEEGELMLTLLSSFAQEESLSVSENCKWRIRDKFKQGISTNFKMLGYELKNNQITVIPKEAKIVKMIFQDYLSGMGINAIVRKLQDKGITTKGGGTWHESTVRKILKNEKYTGNLLLQKTFISNHITKKQLKNKGQLPMYYVESNHEPIIDVDTFQKVQDKIKKQAKHHKATGSSKEYAFTQKIGCGLCGKNYRRKISASGTKYEKPIWICATFNSYGKKYCPSSRVPEEIIKKLSCEVLGITKFDEQIFKNRVSKIVVPSKGNLKFILNDGNEVLKTWDYPSRRDSWTEEMKQMARNRQNGRKTNEHSKASSDNNYGNA
jgi:DNA invertase Pin-like site-specific DNA recombinase